MKILVLDVETAPMQALIWALWDQNVALNQLKTDRHLMSFAAKWYGDPPSKVIYMDQRDAKNIEDDSKLLKKLWDLINESDVLLTQNGRSFDEKIINARFVINGLPPPSSTKHIDTKRIATKRFGFISNKLEYMTEKLNKKFKKLKHKKYPGMELWSECLKGNKAAWNEMKLYNIHDVLALEELYRDHLQPWDNTINVNVYHDTTDTVCMCGSTKFIRNGFAYTSQGKFQRYACAKCNAEVRNKKSVFSKEKKKSLKVKV